MLQQTLVWGVIALLMALTCFWKPRFMRGFMAIFFALMGLGVHGAFLLTGGAPSYIEAMQGIMIPLYRELAVYVVSLNPTSFVVAILIFEVTIAVLILNKGKYVKYGLLAAIVFLVGITPLGWPVMPNIILAIGVWHLVKQNYPLNLIGEYKQWHGKRKK